LALTFNTARAPGKYVIERRDFKPGTGGEREITYIGRVSIYAQFSSVPEELLAKLNESEKKALQDKLLANEPKPLAWMDYLANSIDGAKATIEASAEGDRAAISGQLKVLEEKWGQLLDAARAVGVKRTRKAPEKNISAPAKAPKRGKRGA
jgi:hypothetical protein